MTYDCDLQSSWTFWRCFRKIGVGRNYSRYHGCDARCNSCSLTGPSQAGHNLAHTSLGHLRKPFQGWASPKVCYYDRAWLRTIDERASRIHSQEFASFWYLALCLVHWLLGRNYRDIPRLSQMIYARPLSLATLSHPQCSFDPSSQMPCMVRTS